MTTKFYANVDGLEFNSIAEFVDYLTSKKESSKKTAAPSKKGADEFKQMFAINLNDLDKIYGGNVSVEAIKKLCDERLATLKSRKQEFNSALNINTAACILGSIKRTIIDNEKKKDAYVKDLETLRDLVCAIQSASNVLLGKTDEMLKMVNARCEDVANETAAIINKNALNMTLNNYYEAIIKELEEK